MDKEHQHIIPYNAYLRILAVLLLLTCITITVTVIDLSAWTVMIALLIACIKGFLVMTYFMHLKFESLLLKILALGVILIFAFVLVVTFIDYLNR
jgi:cytochrome c oxidase subunit IV